MIRLRHILGAALFKVTYLVLISSLFVSFDSLTAEVLVSKNLEKSGPTSSIQGKSEEVESNSYRGWDYLVQKLKADGISHEKLTKVYLDKRMPNFETVYFSLRPRESASMYAGFMDKTLLFTAQKFLTQHRRIFDDVERIYRVNRFVIAGIMLVETRFGKNTGKELVLNRLSRIGSIAKPDNIQHNFKKLAREDPLVKFDEVEARARYLEDKFYPEILALFEIAERNKLDPLVIRGSTAGAFGIPQFLPSTYLRFGIDANLDGRVSLFTMQDAIHSTANFLAGHGWSDAATREEKELVIWKYNPSEPYIDTVLYLSEALDRSS